MLRFTLFFILCSVYIFLSGCALVDIDQEVSLDHQGVLITSEILDSIKVGKTTKGWVLDHLGHPGRTEALGGGNELYTYLLRQRVKRRAHILLLFRYKKTKSYQVKFNIEFKKGIVSSVWGDNLQASAEGDEVDEKNMGIRE